MASCTRKPRSHEHENLKKTRGLIHERTGLLEKEIQQSKWGVKLNPNEERREKNPV